MLEGDEPTTSRTIPTTRKIYSGCNWMEPMGTSAGNDFMLSHKKKCSWSKRGITNTHWARRRRAMWFWKWQPLAATRVAASGRQQSLVSGSHLQPAATCSNSSGRKWPPAISCLRQPFAATCSHSSGRKWPPDILPRKLFHIFRGFPRKLFHIFRG